MSFSIIGWLDIWRLLDMDGAVQCEIIYKVTVVCLLNSIWKARNMVRFNDTLISFSSSISSIMATVFSAGNAVSIDSYIGIEDFVILKNFKVSIRSLRAPNNREVLWQPLPRGWFKLNCDGAATSISSVCGGLARDVDGCFVGALASFLDTSNSFIAELTGAMQAIELAHEKN
ncbi:uncharacterized protein LOC131610264 [Vicia villosa]|uniref:uncharacterized protein LOC131610264 n=1 Tax=Vicia villosa TaxID=3911 RepID=UPI00273A8809|nr:uncharacterized protein LOC131610264 [Vicia villosa]